MRKGAEVSFETFIIVLLPSVHSKIDGDRLSYNKSNFYLRHLYKVCLGNVVGMGWEERVKVSEIKVGKVERGS